MNTIRCALFIAFLFVIRDSDAQQIAIPDYPGDKESFRKIKDARLRKELAYFTIEGHDDNNKTSNLLQIPVEKFSVNKATFKKDTVTVSISTRSFNKSKHKLH